MKILHLSTQDIGGGAAIAANRIHCAMKKMGLDSQELVLFKLTKDGCIFPVSKFESKLYTLLRARLESRRKGHTKPEYGLFSYAKYGVDVTEYEAFKQADIIYIHWIHSSFLSLSGIEKIIKSGKKIVFFLHDMWHITGGCHYSFECNKYKIHCNCCQMFLTQKNKDLSYAQFERKKKNFKKYDNISFITPSQWLTQCVKDSSFSRNKPVARIPYPLDFSIYKPVNKEVARNIFNLPQDKQLVCFGAVSGTANPYKGWSYMEEALRNLKKDNVKNIEAVIFGSNFNQKIMDCVPFPVHFTGRLHDAFSLATLYSAVDVYVTPTLADNLPQTCLEALACGTPVVGFNIGGIPDMVEHKKNGCLAEYKNSEDLADGIKYVLFADNYDVLSQNAVNKVKNLSFETTIIEQHLNFLKSC